MLVTLHCGMDILPIAHSAANCLNFQSLSGVVDIVLGAKLLCLNLLSMGISIGGSAVSLTDALKGALVVGIAAGWLPAKLEARSHA